MERIMWFLNEELDLNALPMTHDYSWHHHPRPSDHLHEALKSLGYYLGYHLTHTHVTQICDIQNEKCRHAIFQGQWEGLANDSLKAKKNIDPSVIPCIQQTLAEQKFPIDGYFFDQWIDKLNEQVEKGSLDLMRLTRFLEALFPLIQKCYSTPRSLCNIEQTVPLHNIGQRTGFVPLIEHLAWLEAHLVEMLDTPKTLHGYFQLFISYPLLEETRVSLLYALKNLEITLRQEWVENPDFYFLPMERASDYFDPQPEHYALNQTDSPLIRRFFEGIGGEEFLTDENRSAWNQRLGNQ